MEEVGRRDRIEDPSADVGVEQVADVPGQRGVGEVARAWPAGDGMDVEAARGQRRERMARDEPAGAGDEDPPAGGHAAHRASWSGQARSASETSVIGPAHSIPNAGSSKRTPVAASRT